MNKEKFVNEKSSFRDPCGFVFYYENKVYRAVSETAKNDYELLMKDGLYKKLQEKKLLVSHKEVENKFEIEAYKILNPKKIDFISYPYEWSFNQFKDAALATLKIQKISMEFGMTLKDASSYNIQFENGQPVFIDSLSFEKLEEKKPWSAYKQFCQHFLAPLLLMSYRDVRISLLMRDFIDGIPLDIARKLLPFKSKLNPGVFLHIVMHSRTQNYFSDKTLKTKEVHSSGTSLFALIDNLESLIKKLNWKSNTEWGEYYSFTNYNDVSFKQKKEIIQNWLKNRDIKNAWDLGGNTGEFSRIISEQKISTVCFDIDHNAVDKNYLTIKKNNEKNILPLCLDLTNPSPSIGWANSERKSFSERGPVDMVMALALIHHLAISNNLPFRKIGKYFSELTKRFLIIEFVPKDDSNAAKLLRNRVDIFYDYQEEIFKTEFLKYFNIIDENKIQDTKRTLYLMEKK